MGTPPIADVLVVMHDKFQQSLPCDFSTSPCI